MIKKLNIIYEDNHILVVEKPANIPTQADSSGDEDMLNLLKKYLIDKYNKKGDAFVGLVHRLDRPTAGLMVFAKTSKAASRISDQIRRGKFKKKYRAIVEGETDKEGFMEDYMIKDREKNKSFITNNIEKGKLAKLKYRQIRYDKKTNTSLVDIELLTGRHHQIRLQFSSRNHPICSDAKYNKRSEKGNLCLYSYFLSFKHPVKDEILEFKYIPDKYM